MNERTEIHTPQKARPAPSASPMADPMPQAPPTPTDSTSEAPRVSGKVRKPFGTVESKLAWPPIPGFELRWFNDSPGRIERAKEAGYEHVLNDKGQPVTQTVGVAERGGGLSGFLMKIPKEFYDADFATKQGAVDQIDEAIYRGNYKQEAGDRRYVPKDGIKIGVKRGR